MDNKLKFDNPFDEFNYYLNKINSMIKSALNHFDNFDNGDGDNYNVNKDIPVDININIKDWCNRMDKAYNDLDKSIEQLNAKYDNSAYR